MKILLRSVAMIGLFMFVSPRADAQYYHVGQPPLPLTNTSLSWSITPRGVALGEATVALPAFGAPFAANPAGLANCRGIWSTYASQPYFATGADYRSGSVGVATTIGTFMATYRQFNNLPIVVSTVASESHGGVAEYDWYDRTLGIAWGSSFGAHVRVGVAAKQFDEKFPRVSGTTPPGTGMIIPKETTPSYVIDLGLLCTTGTLLGGEEISDDFSVGVALQGFGTPYRLRYDPAPYPYYYAYWRANIQPLDRNLRIGFAYRLSIKGTTSESLQPFSTTLMSEFRQVLNSRYYGGSYWGFGLETSILEVLNLRVGGLAQPTDGPYGHQNTLKERYGIGLHIPLARLGDWLPALTLEGDYAWMPLAIYSFVDYDPSTLRVFSFGVRYEP
jgi:hypothetical protein